MPELLIEPPYDLAEILTTPVPVLVPLILDTEIPEPELVVVKAIVELALEASEILNAPVTVIAPLDDKLIEGATDVVPVNEIPVEATPRVPVIFATTLPAPLIVLVMVVLVAS